MLNVLGEDDGQRDGEGTEERDAGGIVRKGIQRDLWLIKELKTKSMWMSSAFQCLLHSGVYLAACSRGWAQHCGITQHWELFVCVLTKSSLQKEKEWREWDGLYWVRKQFPVDTVVQFHVHIGIWERWSRMHFNNQRKNFSDKLFHLVTALHSQLEAAFVFIFAWSPWFLIWCSHLCSRTHIKKGHPKEWPTFCWKTFCQTDMSSNLWHRESFCWRNILSTLHCF